MTTTLTRPTRTARPSGDRSRLAAIADKMRRNTVQPGQYDRAKLVNGLDIILHHVGEQRWRLAMAREDAYPSDVEVRIVREVFQAPESADESRSEKQHTHPKTNRQITYRRVEITWKEL